MEALKKVGIPQPEKRMDSYPYELSGGMCQRVIIAMAVCCKPKMIIADEPTTALDVTVQAQVLELLQELQKEMNTSILLITHNLGVVWKMCDTVMVMYAGKTVEYAAAETLYRNPMHPYTWGLLDSMPKLSDKVKEELKTIPGTPPDLRLTGTGCNFCNRCPYAEENAEQRFLRWSRSKKVILLPVTDKIKQKNWQGERGRKMDEKKVILKVRNLTKNLRSKAISWEKNLRFFMPLLTYLLMFTRERHWELSGNRDAENQPSGNAWYSCISRPGKCGISG